MLSIRLWKRQNHLHGWWRLFCRFDLEGEILGKSSELASSPNRHQLLSPKPRRAGEAQAGPVASVISPNCRRPTGRPGTGSLRPQQEVFTNPAGPGAWSGISRTSRQHVFPESSRVIKPSRPDETPGRPRLQSHGLAPVCLCARTTGVWPQETDGMPVNSRRHRKTYLPEADMYENYF